MNKASFLAGFGAFWRKNKRNKFLMILGIFLLIGIIGSACGGDSEKETTYEWPDNSMSQMLPEPEGTITWLSTTDGEYLSADVDCDVDEYKEYVEACKDKGFDIDQKSSQSGDSYYYDAKNKKDLALSVNYIADSMSISLTAKEEEEEAEETTEAAEKETAAAKKKDSGSKVSPDFKKTMDSYEEFMDKYVDFMKKYENSDDVASMMGDYADMMEQYSDYMDKIEAIDEDELSDADLAYYLKVTARVEKKLAEVAY